MTSLRAVPVGRFSKVVSDPDDFRSRFGLTGRRSRRAIAVVPAAGPPKSLLEVLQRPRSEVAPVSMPAAHPGRRRGPRHGTWRSGGALEARAQALSRTARSARWREASLARTCCTTRRPDAGQAGLAEGNPGTDRFGGQPRRRCADRPCWRVTSRPGLIQRQLDRRGEFGEDRIDHGARSALSVGDGSHEDQLGHLRCAVTRAKRRAWTQTLRAS